MNRLFLFIKSLRQKLSLWSAKYYLGPTDETYWERFKTREDHTLSEWQRLESKPYKKTADNYRGGF